jgi:N-acetylneuraminic acid mutarotase
VEVKRTDRAWEATVPEAAGCVVARKDWGILEKNGARYKLTYYAKCLLGLDPAKHPAAPIESQRLDLVPAWKDGQPGVVAFWMGKPLAGAEVTVEPFEGEKVVGKTDDSGRFGFATGPGVSSVRVKHVEAAAGEEGGKSYSEVRHYSSLVFAQPEARVDRAVVLPDVPHAVTSFGAAVIGDTVYLAGGHLGESHEYNNADQSDELWSLELGTKSDSATNRSWKVVSKMPRLQGLAMVAHGGKLYRVGGFEARNTPEQPKDLHSLASFARFDPATNQWTDLAPLPEGRSSLDAAVVGNDLYVVGGWKMSGKGTESVWHDTVWKADLSKDTIAWQPVPSPGFQRRAITAAAHGGKLYVIGGMSSDNKVVPNVSIFDPSSGTWSEGPALTGDTMEAFGASAFAQHGRLYVTGLKGRVLRLSDDGGAWEQVGQLDKGRFFHRLLPMGDDRLIVVGGSSRAGRVTTVELLKVSGR